MLSRPLVDLAGFLMANILNGAAIVLAVGGTFLLLASAVGRKDGPAPWGQVQATAGTGFILIAHFIRGFA